MLTDERLREMERTYPAGSPRNEIGWAIRLAREHVDVLPRCEHGGRAEVVMADYGHQRRVQSSKSCGCQVYAPTMTEACERWREMCSGSADKDGSSTDSGWVSCSPKVAEEMCPTGRGESSTYSEIAELKRRIEALEGQMMAAEPALREWAARTLGKPDCGQLLRRLAGAADSLCCGDCGPFSTRPIVTCASEAHRVVYELIVGARDG